MSPNTKGTMEGPSPFNTQVQAFVNTWRTRHKRNSSQPVIDSRKRRMYGVVKHIAESGDGLLVSRDSDENESTLVPKLGNGSSSSPFVLGILAIHCSITTSKFNVTCAILRNCMFTAPQHCKTALSRVCIRDIRLWRDILPNCILLHFEESRS
ncbi:hypothetical protein F442_21566 [Phytophthora nicotianae P10297]|uniref:Uncharacterized protein n=1 Tax=Phytophthora nicotianae P10297 TaxID=1317064 RepID=W2Y512_PHYNI|nr:hypothetical protein F442_21566 [Phytophthora nicotianae P10297]